MRATTTLLENNRIMLTVEIDDAEMDEAMDAAAKVLSKQVSVRAFARARSQERPDRQYRRHFGSAH